MLNLLVVAFTLVAALLGACSSETNASNNFRDQVKAATTATHSSSEPYLNRHHAKWAKRMFQITDLKYDVRKTESLVSPLVGTVMFTLSSTQTQLVADRESAKQSNQYTDSTDVFTVELYYALQDGAWKMTTGRYSSPDLPGTSFELNPEKIRLEPDAIPHAALVPWITVK
jgi:hypothetical protein